MARDSEGRRGRRRPARSSCALGCLGVLSVLAAIFVVMFGSTGSYRPKIAPPRPLPNPNAFDDYVAAGRIVKTTGGTRGMYGPNGAKPASIAAEQTAVDASQAALARLRMGFEKECGVPSARSFAALFPYLADTRELGRLLAADADVKDARGDHFRAFDAALDGIRLGCDIERGGTIIHGLVGIAIQAIVREPMLRSLEKLSADDCDVLATRLQAILLRRPGFDENLDEERNAMLASLLHMRDSDFIPTFNWSADSGPPPAAYRTFGGMYWHFMRDRTLHEIEQCFAAQEREARKPGIQRRPVPEPKSPIAAMIAPVFMQAGAKWDETDARNRMILIALKLRSWRLRHGSVPATIDPLGIEPSLLIDPYSGGRLIYRPLGEDYLLYSIGPDFKDDGGVPADETTNDSSMANLNGIPQGDFGIRPFRHTLPASATPSPYYRRVPHMKPPKLRPGWKPLPG